MRRLLHGAERVVSPLPGLRVNYGVQLMDTIKVWISEDERLRRIEQRAQMSNRKLKQVKIFQPTQRGKIKELDQGDRKRRMVEHG